MTEITLRLHLLSYRGLKPIIRKVIMPETTFVEYEAQREALFQRK